MKLQRRASLCVDSIGERSRVAELWLMGSVPAVNVHEAMGSLAPHSWLGQPSGW